MKHFILCASILFSSFSNISLLFAQAQKVERWGVFELTLKGTEAGNPFKDVQFSAVFTHNNNPIKVPGFYNGSGEYKIRFSPPQTGNWKYSTTANVAELNNKTGELEVTSPTAANHGPVEVTNVFHFQYKDQTPYLPVGTTCYVWNHQTPELEVQTIETLKQSPFNKMRMCVFPKNYEYNKNEPPFYPFPGKPGAWDKTRFNPAYFNHLEEKILDLQKLGIEADIIIFHPYDDGRWGFDQMSAEEDDFYLRYLIARISAYRNVWWSLANEFDFMKHKKLSDWDRYLRILVEEDPHQRLRSIHNGTVLYDHNKPGITHASIQNGSAVSEFGRGVLYKDAYRKPIVFDEVKYEGNLPQRWGNISAQEMSHRFWIGFLEGTFVGHGETYLDKQDVIWWAKGGVLHGESPARISFLRKILEAGPTQQLDVIDKWQDNPLAGSQSHNYFIMYFGKSTPDSWTLSIPTKGRTDDVPIPPLKAEIIDTWEMTITPVSETFNLEKSSKYKFSCKNGGVIRLPQKPYMAVRLTVK